jgi:predicted short-subunit dehydrogenase-like oxidoreductase (DUF2520 family)
MSTRAAVRTKGGTAVRPPGRSMEIGIVGVGRVGAVLGAALARAGHRIVAASGGSPNSAARAARLLPGTRLVAPERVGRGADLVIISVPDDALADVVWRLVGARGLRAGQVVAHTSGAHGLGVLAPAAALGARPVALHPAMTFTGHAEDLDRLAEGVSFGVTAPDELRPLATRLVADLGGSVEWIAESDRALYHAALAHGANHLITLVNEAMDRLRDSGVVHPEQVLAPLLRASLENTLRYGDAALTGPVARGDAGTVARHIDVLRSTAPDSLPTYVALARRTADRAIASQRLRAVDAGPLLDVLAQDNKPPALGRAPRPTRAKSTR